jgi:hypothetical protein
MCAFLTTRSHGIPVPWLHLLVWALLVVLLAQAPAQAQQPLNRSAAVTLLRTEFARAQALLEARRPDEARAILERLVIAAPETPAFRLLLAELLLRQGVADRARFHYQALRGARLAPADRAHVEGRLATLAADKRWAAHLSFGLVPQSNVGKRTADDTITIGGIDFLLDDASRARSGTGLSYSAGLTRRVVLAPATRLRFGVQASGFVYADRRFNDMRLNALAALERQAGQNLTVEMGLNHTLRLLADRPHARGPGLWLAAKTRLGRATVLTTRVQVDWLTHPDAPGLDGARRGLSLGLHHQASPTLALTAQLSFDRTDARQPAQAGNGATLALGLRHAFAGGVTVGLDASLRRDARDAPDALFGLRRQDHTTSVALKLMRRDLRIFNHAPMIEIRHEQRRSTLPLAAFRNTSVGLYLSREF